MGQNLGDQWFVEVSLKLVQVPFRPQALSVIEHIDRAAVLTPELVRRSARMGAQMNVDQGLLIDLGGIEGHNHSFGPGLIGRGRTDEPLGDVADATRRLKHGFGAPVTPAAETHLLRQRLLDAAVSSQAG